MSCSCHDDPKTLRASLDVLREENSMLKLQIDLGHQARRELAATKKHLRAALTWAGAGGIVRARFFTRLAELVERDA